MRFIADSSQGIGKIKIRFSGCAGDWEGQRRDGTNRGLHFYLCKRKENSSVGNRFLYTQNRNSRIGSRVC